MAMLDNQMVVDVPLPCLIARGYHLMLVLDVIYKRPEEELHCFPGLNLVTTPGTNNWVCLNMGYRFVIHIAIESGPLNRWFTDK